MEGKLRCEVLEGVKVVGRIETLLIFPVTALHLAVVAGRVGRISLCRIPKLTALE